MTNFADKYSVEKVLQIHQDLRNDRSEWEAEWRKISDWLLPGRGIYQTYTKPPKRKLTNKNIINPAGEDALNVLVSGLYGRMSSPSMPWFKFTWPAHLQGIDPLVAWLQESQKLTNAGMLSSGYYSVLEGFYTEFCGYGTASDYTGSDSDDPLIPFNFELLTAGEYCFAKTKAGATDSFIRTLFMSQKQLVDEFGADKVSDSTKKAVNENIAGIHKVDRAVIELTVKDTYKDKPYGRVFYEVTGADSANRSPRLHSVPLRTDGFYECPYTVSTWGKIGQDTYGVGLGSRSIPDIRRLQEMEKAFLMATHKSIEPPLNAPAKMKGKLNSLPGAKNYYANPAEVVTPLYNVNFDFSGVSAAVQRVEERIQRNFFNEVFLTASRDPNASPLKAAQVHNTQSEQMYRLAPVVEKLYMEKFTPQLKRCFNIMLRKGMFPPLDPALAELAEDFSVTLVSPLATSLLTLQGQNTDKFMSYVGAMAQFDPEAIDNVNIDESIAERARIEGVDYGVLRKSDDRDAIRKNRAAMQQEQARKEEGMQALERGGVINNQDANTKKLNAESGAILAETFATANTLPI